MKRKLNAGRWRCRRGVMRSVLSFVFNTAILANAIDIAVSML